MDLTVVLMPSSGRGRHPLQGKKAFLIGVKPYPGRELTLPSQPFGYTQTVVRLYPNAGAPFLHGCRVGADFLQSVHPKMALIISRLSPKGVGGHTCYRFLRYMYELFFVKKEYLQNHIVLIGCHIDQFRVGPPVVMIQKNTS